METINQPGIISFTVTHSKFKLKNRMLLKKAITAFIQSKGFAYGDISYILCDDAYLTEVNKKYLKHNTLTDVITFDYSDKGSRISGDIFISIERVTENASIFNNTFSTELCRVIAHGLLHLMGVSDKSKSERADMAEKEDEALVYFNDYLQCFT